MADFILVTGDEAIFLPAFGQAVVTVRPAELEGSGKATLKGKKVCIDGDEKKVKVDNCMYITPVYSIPGVGTLTIAALGADQKAKKTNSNGKPVLLMGSMFTATFEVKTKAQQPPPGTAPPVPDPTPKYSGKGKFITMNRKWRGT